MNYSLEQKKAINTSNTNVLVFASAGAGKTTVLIERLMKRIIEDRVSLDEILAMTFTEAAASNMKYRLEAKLRECDQNDPYIVEQLSALSTANISTIHSFCLSLIKEYYYLLGIKKKRIDNILNEADKSNLLLEAYNKSLSEYEDLRSINSALSSSIFNTDKLFETIMIIFNKASSNYDPIAWLNNHKIDMVSKYEDINEDIRRYYLDDIKSYLKVCINYTRKLIETGNDYSLFENNLLDCLDENDYRLLVSKLENNFKTLPKVNTDKDNKYRDTISDTLGKIASKLINPNKVVDIANKSAEVINKLIEFTILFYENYEALKIENNVLDFDDFEHYAYKLLTINNNEIAIKLKHKYKEVMIDEFQDTNDTQYKIASLIADNNLFVVGDQKQSIYRFRNARPEIMENLKHDASFTLVHIRDNYRSQANIVNFNNELYTRIMNILSNGYPEEDIQTYNIKEGELPELLLNNSEDFSEFDLIANKIMDLLSRGYKYKDIAILVKSHGKKTPMRLSLDKYNIPYFLLDKEGYLASKSIDVIISYLKLLLDKDDLISKVSVLSSLYDVGDNDLVILKDKNFDYDLLNKDLEELDKLVKDNKLLEVINYILCINNFYEDLPLLEKSNIDLFINEYKDYSSLYELINYLEFSKEYETNSASTIYEDADVVRVMTMHTSKGLQFPVVFVLSESKNQMQENRSPILVDSELGIGMDYIYNEYKDAYPSIYSMALKAKINKDSLLEYLRLFYVATTRAIDKLYIVDNINEFNNKNIDESLLYDRKGFTSFLFDLKYLNVNIVDSLNEYTPLKKNDKTYNVIPKKNFKINKINNNKASSHSNEKLFYKEVVEKGTLIHEFFEDLDINNPVYTNLVSNDVVDNFINSEIINKCKNYEIHKELEFTSKENNEYIHGYMDFVSIGKEEIILIDYKTNVNISKDDLINLYSRQMDIYKKVLENKYHLPVKAYLYSSYLKEFVIMQLKR